jgi:hypothetical protein
MNSKSFLNSILLSIGIFFILLTLISVYFLLTSFIERQRHGSGLLFADVELFAFAAIVFCFLGIISIYFSRRVSRKNQKEN